MKVLITGMSIWCALGRTLRSFEERVRAGRCGQRAVTRFDVSDPFYRTTTAAVLEDEEALDQEVDETRIADLTLRVARAALDDAGLAGRSWIADPGRFGMALGTSHGGNIAYMKFIRGRLGRGGKIDHRLLLSGSATVLGQVAGRLGVRGPVLTVSTACASGTNSIGRAAELIRAGRADVMLAGGADLFTELSFSGFNVLGAMTRGLCRPLDRARDGMLLGDGAAVVVLESAEHARGRRAYAEVAGHAIANEAYHATAPRPDGSAAARVMRLALADAGVDAGEIDYINLHATGTAANDEAELRAVAQVFGARAPEILISATKSMVGHTLGAAGSVELVTTALGMAGGYAPPGIHLKEPMPDFAGWSYVRDEARPARIRAALSNSFGFAGNLACIVLRNPFLGDRS